MTASYTPGSGNALDDVRLLITDTDIPNNPIFQDEEIDRFLSLEDSNVRLASAMALEVIASQEALILKVLQVGDIRTDGAKLAAELRARAAVLRQEADEVIGGYVEMVVNDFSYRERLRSRRLRGL